jgi:Arc/MetJ-type ribon-helix-helix transcriptional regulator
MEVRLRPELAELIKQDVQRGPFENIDEFVEHAVSMLHEQEAWLAANRTDIRQRSQKASLRPSAASSSAAMLYGLGWPS